MMTIFTRFRRPAVQLYEASLLAFVLNPTVLPAAVETVYGTAVWAVSALDVLISQLEGESQRMSDVQFVNASLMPTNLVFGFLIWGCFVSRMLERD